jgi:hypothetical protein
MEKGFQGGVAMSSESTKRGDVPEQPIKLEFENGIDTAGMWFAAGAIFAMLAAGVILYRAVDSDIRTASHHAMSMVSTTR